MDAQQVARLEAEWARLAGVLSLLLQAVVTIDEADGSAILNEAASRLFALPSGLSPVRPVTAALESLMSDALNQPEISRMRARLADDRDAVVTSSLWSFQEPVRYLRVMTRPLPPSSRVWVFDDVTRQTLLLREVERSLVDAAAAEERWRVSIDSLIDPQILLEPVRDETATVVDFWFLDVNRAMCEHHGISRGAFLGSTLLSRFPELAGSPFLALCIDALEAKDPPVVEDFRFGSDPSTGAGRRYDLHASHVGDRLVVNLRDVTVRHETQRRLAESDAALRACTSELRETRERVKTLEGLRAPTGD